MMEKSISIIGRDDNVVQSKGLTTTSRSRHGELPLQTLQENLATFINDLQIMFKDISISTPQYELDEIELKIDVSVTGGISLIGSAEMGTSGGITLTFKKRHEND